MPDPINASEPVSIGFRTKETTGEVVLAMDSLSQTAIVAGYDALRIASAAKAADDTVSETAALSVVDAARERCKAAGTALVVEAGKRAAACLKPGGSAKDRAQVAAMLKGALRAARVAHHGMKVKRA